MDQAEYEALCKKAEELAGSNPSGYKRKLYAYSIIGHVVLFGLLLVLIGLVVGMGAIAFLWSGLFLLLVKKKLIFVLLPLIWVIARALWVKFDKPTGFELKREEFPELFVVIDELQNELDTPPIHQVLLTGEFNASITQTPRLGVFGWQHNTLTLGLTLLLSLSPEQARSVIAHELGHLSGSHSAFAARIYRSRIAWQRVMMQVGGNDSFGGQILYKFFGWYAPRFSAYSFALARKNEYEADSVAASLTSKEDAGSALVAVHTLARQFEGTYWESLYKTADFIREPHNEPWRKLKDYIAVEKKRDNHAELDRAMAYTSDYQDTHPSLKQRLENLNTEAVFQESNGTNACEQWFGNKADDIFKWFDEQWSQSNRDGWKERYNYVQESKTKIAQIEAANKDTYDHEGMWEKINLWCEFKSEDEQLAVVNYFIKENPTDANLRYVRGRTLAAQGDETCLDDLKIATTSEEVSISACSIAYEFLTERDRPDEAYAWMEKAEQQQREHYQKIEEMCSLDKNDNLRTAKISSERREEIVKALVDSNLVKKAWIAEKEVAEGSQAPIAIAVKVKKFFVFSESKVIDQIHECLPDMDGWVFRKDGDYKDLAKMVIKVKDRLV